VFPRDRGFHICQKQREFGNSSGHIAALPAPSDELAPRGQRRQVMCSEEPRAVRHHSFQHRDGSPCVARSAVPFCETRAGAESRHMVGSENREPIGNELLQHGNCARGVTRGAERLREAVACDHRVIVFGTEDTQLILKQFPKRLKGAVRVTSPAAAVGKKEAGHQAFLFIRSEQSRVIV